MPLAPMALALTFVEYLSANPPLPFFQPPLSEYFSPPPSFHPKFSFPPFGKAWTSRAYWCRLMVGPSLQWSLQKRRSVADEPMTSLPTEIVTHSRRRDCCTIYLTTIAPFHAVAPSTGHYHILQQNMLDSTSLLRSIALLSSVYSINTCNVGCAFLSLFLLVFPQYYCFLSIWSTLSKS